MIKMLKQNMTQHWTQTTGLGVAIGKCSPKSQHVRPDRRSANVGCPSFRYTSDNLRNYTNQRRKRKTWTMEDNQLALHYYFRSNHSRRGYRKRMIEIWRKCSNFQNTSQTLADQVRTIIKKDWFSDLEIIEIHQKINNLRGSNTVPDISTINKQKQPNQNEPLSSENGKTTQTKNAQSNNPEQALSQELK